MAADIGSHVFLFCYVAFSEIRTQLEDQLVYDFWRGKGSAF